MNIKVSVVVDLVALMVAMKNFLEVRENILSREFLERGITPKSWLFSL